MDAADLTIPEPGVPQASRPPEPPPGDAKAAKGAKGPKGSKATPTAPAPQPAGPAAGTPVQVVGPDGLPVVEAVPPVPEATVRALLVATGYGVGVLPGISHPAIDGHWHFTDDELDALAPPVTRIVNRTPALRRAAHHGDYAVIATHLAGYGGRNWWALQRQLTADEEAQADAHTPGVPQDLGRQDRRDPGPGPDLARADPPQPEHGDPAGARVHGPTDQ